MRALAPLALLAAAVVALWLAPPSQPLFGLSHDDFARGALGASLLLWLTLSGLARAGPAGTAQVLTSVAFWAVLGIALVTVYAYRFELSEVVERVVGELDPAVAQVGPSGEVVVRRRLGGEFVVPARVNGRRVRFLLDTGASSVVLSAEDAAGAGLRFADADFQVEVTTANGATTAALTRLDRVAIGPIVVTGVPALVARPGALGESLLGMSFLERLQSFSVEGDRLILKGK